MCVCVCEKRTVNECKAVCCENINIGFSSVAVSMRVRSLKLSTVMACIELRAVLVLCVSLGGGGGGD